MGQINVRIGGRSYPLSCRDGEEARLTRLGQHLARKAEDLAATLGQMSEPRLLLMAGILVCDELFELREGAPAPDPAAVDALLALADRIEAMAQALETEAVTS